MSIISFLCLRKHMHFHSAIVFLLMFYCLCVLFINLPELIYLDKKGAMIEAGVWSINFGLFFVAQDESLWAEIENRGYYIPVIFFIFAVSPILLTFVLGSGLNANFSLRHVIQLMNINNATNHIVSYQSYGDKLALLSFLAFCITKNKKTKIAIVIFSVITFYVIASKAGLFGFVSALFLWNVVSAMNKKNKLKLLVILYLILVGPFYIKTVVIGYSGFIESENWIVRLLATGTKDSSVFSRKEIQMKNYETMSSRVFLGDYKFDVKAGRPGTYTHNVSFFIEYYGIFYFITFILFWIYLIIFNIKSKRNGVLRDYVVLSMLYFSVLMLVARAGSEYLMYWTLGCACVTLRSKTLKLLPTLNLSKFTKE